MKKVFMRFSLVCICLCIGFSMFSITIFAAEDGKEKQISSDSKNQDTISGKKESNQKKSGQSNRIVVDDIKIVGKIHKPQAYYVLPRSNLNIEGLKLDESFIPKIVDSVGEEPF